MDESGNSLPIKSAAGIGTALIHQYPDAFHGTAVQVAKASETLVKTVNVALLPLRGLAWGAEKFEAWCRGDLSEKLADVPPENIQTPKGSIAAPILRSLQYTADSEPELAEMFTSLLATAMTKSRAHAAHPSFVEVINSLTSDEARILLLIRDGKSLPFVEIVGKTPAKLQKSLFRCVTPLAVKAGCCNHENVAMFVDNLIRLHVVEAPIGMLRDEEYKECNEMANDLIGTLPLDEWASTEIVQHWLRLTDFGKAFMNVCLPQRKASALLKA